MYPLRTKGKIQVLKEKLCYVIYVQYVQSEIM